MDSEVTRIVIAPTRQGIGSLQSAVEIATNRCAELGYSGEIVLLVPGKDSIEGSVFSLLYGDPVVEALLRNQRVAIRGYKFRLETPITIRTLRPEVVLVLFAHDSTIHHIDNLHSVRLVIAAPEFMEEIPGWVTKWKPIVEESLYSD